MVKTKRYIFTIFFCENDLNSIVLYSDQQYLGATEINSDFKSAKNINIDNSLSIDANKNGDDDEEYPMSNKPRGKAIIFNHSKHDSNLGLSEREGSKQDRQRITRVLVRLGFETEICDDFTFDRIKQKLKSGMKFHYSVRVN